MAIVRKLHQGDVLTTGYQTLQTASCGLATLGYLLRKITIVNVLSATSTGTTLATADVHLCVESSSPGLSNRIASVRVNAADTVAIDGPWWLSSGATVQARLNGATSTGMLVARLTAFEETTA